jgi:hypothetical protein
VLSEKLARTVSGELRALLRPARPSRVLLVVDARQAV